jgi:predicted dehydrogenase
LKHQCRHFLDCVRTGRRPISSGAEGRDVVRVLEAVNRSIESKGLQVEVQGKGEYVHTSGDAVKASASAVR